MEKFKKNFKVKISQILTWKSSRGSRVMWQAMWGPPHKVSGSSQRKSKKKKVKVKSKSTGSYYFDLIFEVEIL